MDDIFSPPRRDLLKFCLFTLIVYMDLSSPKALGLWDFSFSSYQPGASPKHIF